MAEPLREILKKVNTAEVEALGERWQSPELLEAVSRFMNRYTHHLLYPLLTVLSGLEIQWQICNLGLIVVL